MKSEGFHRDGERIKKLRVVIGRYERGVALSLGLALLVVSCQEKTESGTTGDDVPQYYHPSVSTAPSGTTSTSAPKTVVKELSASADVVLESGATKVTIPAGALRSSGTAVLQAFAGPFVNSSSVRLVTESFSIVITKADNSDFAYDEVYKDIQIEQKTLPKTTGSRLVAMFEENSGLSNAEKTAISAKRFSVAPTLQTDSSYKVSYDTRTPRLGFVVAETPGGGVPGGYGDFVRPAKDPSAVTASATSPADVAVTWTGDPRFNQDYGLVAWASGETEPDCTKDKIVDATTETTITSATTAAEYAAALSGLLDNTTYYIKACGLTSRSPADSSGGSITSVVTPARAHAVLSNAPADPSSTTALNVTVSGSNVVSYKYALLESATTCVGATLSDWIDIGTPITNAVTQATGTAMRLCVFGKIDETNEQLLATEVAWTVDKTPPVFTSLALAAPALDGYLSTADRSLTTTISGTLTGSGYDAAQVGMRVVTNATTCNGSLVYSTTLPAANSSLITTDGSYKICVKLTDAAGNTTYGASSAFVVDTAIAFTAVNLANGAANSYVNLAEVNTPTAVVSAATGSGFTTRKYVVASNATTCNSALTYSTSIPTTSNANFTADGDYKVCVQLSDLAGNTAYGSSSVIHRKVSQPSVTSISLANAAVDGYLNISEHLLSSDLAGAVVGLNYDTAQYALTLAATACSSLGSWGTMPKADDSGINSDGSLYKVCVKLTDLAGNPAVYGQTASFENDQTAPIFTSLSLDGPASDAYLNSTEVAAASAVHTAAVATGASAITYAVSTAAGSCTAGLTYGSSLIVATDSGFTSGSSYKICAELVDAAGNVTYGGSSSFAVVVAAPDCTGILLTNGASDQWISQAEHGTSAAISGAASTTLAGAIKTYALIAANGACDATATFGLQDSIPTLDDATLADGSSFKVCAKITDAAGNTPAYCASVSVAADYTAPVFTSLTLANTAADGVINIAEHAGAVDVVGPLTASDYTVSDYVAVTAATSCAGPLSYTGVFPTSDAAAFATSGSYKVCVRLADAAGNLTYDQSPTITSDQTAPVFNSLDVINEASNGYINLAESVSIQDAAGNLNASGQTTTLYAVVDSAALCSTGTFAASVPTVTDIGAQSEGTYKICVKLIDASGNETLGSSGGVILDKTPPAFTSVALTLGANDTYINAAEHALSQNLVTPAAGSGYDSLHYSLVMDGTACNGVAAGWGTSIPKSDSSDFGADGDYALCVKMSDFAGNPDAFGISGTIHLKTDFPVFTSLDLANHAADQYLNASEHADSQDLAANLVATGQVSTQYGLTLQATTCNGSLTYGVMPTSSSSVLSSAGQFKVCTALTDIAGNVSFGSSSAFEFDPTAPVFTSIAFTNDVSDGWLNLAEHSAANDLGGSLTGSGYSTSEFVVTASATTCDSLLTYGSMPKSNAVSITDGGTWKLCVKLTDAAGNSTYGSSSSTFQSDFAVPSFTSVALTGVAADGYINAADSAAASNLVTAAVGSNHNSTLYVAAASGTTCDGSLTYGASIPKSNDGALSSDGTYKVCVQLTDTAGNPAAYGSSSDIVKDATKPTSAVTTTGTLTPSSTVGPTTVIAGTASDGGAGVAKVEISLQEGTGDCFDADQNTFTASCPNWIVATGTTNWSYAVSDRVLLKGLTYTVESRATDLAVATGNVQTSFGSNSFAYTAAEGAVLWTSPITFDNGGDDRATSATLDSSGNLYIVGWKTNIDKNWLIKKFDIRGNEDTTDWNKDIGDNGSDEVAYAVAVDSSTDDVYVVGSRHNGADLDWWLKKFSGDGVEDASDWDVILDGNNGNDEALAVAVDTSHNVYVLGYGTNIASGSSGEDLWLRKYSSAGALSCQLVLDAGGASLADRGLSLAVNNAIGRLYIAGYQTASGPDQQLMVKRVRTNDCTADISVAGNSTGSSDQASSLRLDSSGNVYVLGRTSRVDTDWWIRKYTSTLALSSEIDTAVAGAHQGLAIAIDASNRIYTAGYKTNGTEDGWLRKFTTSLVEDTVNWNKELDGNSGNDRLTALVIGAATGDIGAVYAVGWSTNLVGGTSGTDWWIQKFAAP